MNLMERLNDIERRVGVGSGAGIALVFWHESKESREDLDARIARWKAGEKVEGVSDDYRNGMGYRVIKFVKFSSPRIHDAPRDLH